MFLRESTVQLPQTLKIKIIVVKFRFGLCEVYIFYNHFIMLEFNNFSKSYDYNRHTHTIHLKKKTLSETPKKKILAKKFQNFLYFLVLWCCVKIFYIGKGYKIKKYKNQNLISFSFGACHLNILYLKNYKLKFKRKKSILIYYKFSNFLKINVDRLIKIKPLNLYTQRGLKTLIRPTYRKPKQKATFI